MASPKTEPPPGRSDRKVNVVLATGAALGAASWLALRWYGAG